MRRPQAPQQLWTGMGEAWTAVSTLISGIVVWGGIGMGLDKLLHTRPILTAVGALLGNFLAIYLIYARATREATRAS